MNTYKVIKSFRYKGKEMVIVRLREGCHIMELWEWKSVLRARNSKRQKMVRL